MRLFVRLVERQSFTAAAADLGIPRSTASEVLRGLEAHLGARLLERTTRHVTPTLDGEDYYRRCVAIRHMRVAVDRRDSIGCLGGFVSLADSLCH